MDKAPVLGAKSFSNSEAIGTMDICELILNYYRGEILRTSNP
jgi:hypothetical protein